MHNIVVIMASLIWVDHGVGTSFDRASLLPIGQEASIKPTTSAYLQGSVEVNQFCRCLCAKGTLCPLKTLAMLLVSSTPLAAFTAAGQAVRSLPMHLYALTSSRLEVSDNSNCMRRYISDCDVAMVGAGTVIVVHFDEDITLQCYQHAASSGERIYLLPAVLIDGMMHNSESALRRHFGDDVSRTVSNNGWSHELHVPRTADAGPVGKVLADALQKVGVDVSLTGDGTVLLATPHPEHVIDTILSHAQMMRLQKDPSGYASDLSRQLLNESEVQQFWRDGAVVVPGALQRVLGREAVGSLHEDIEQLSSRGFLSPPSATLNRGSSRRSDLIGFTNEHAAMRADPPLKMLARVITLMKGVVHELNDAGLRSMLINTAQQIALFEPGGRYERHVDLLGKDTSLDGATLILYVNDADWPEEAGGQLRLYDWPNLGENFDVLPRGGTLVAFRSPMTEHEILPIRGRQRLALTLWAQEESDSTEWDWQRRETSAEMDARQHAW